VNVFDTTMKSVASGSAPASARSRSSGSTFAAKRNSIAVLAHAERVDDELGPSDEPPVRGGRCGGCGRRRARVGELAHALERAFTPRALLARALRDVPARASPSN
jgi:hypothetical protein